MQLHLWIKKYVCWLSRMRNAVLLHLHPVSIPQPEIQPSPEPIWSGSGMPSFQKELAIFPFSRPRRTGIVRLRTGGDRIWTGSIPIRWNCLWRRSKSRCWSLWWSKHNEITNIYNFAMWHSARRLQSLS